MKLYFETTVNKSFPEIREGFGRELFQFLSPSVIPYHLKRFDGCKNGDEIHIQLGPRFLALEWVSLITFEEANASGWSFIDEGKVLPFPLKYWKHHHRVDKISGQKSLIVDDITFGCSPGFLAPLVKPVLWMVFSLRPRRYKIFFEGNL